MASTEENFEEDYGLEVAAVTIYKQEEPNCWKMMFLPEAALLVDWQKENAGGGGGGAGAGADGISYSSDESQSSGAGTMSGWGFLMVLKLTFPGTNPSLQGLAARAASAATSDGLPTATLTNGTAATGIINENISNFVYQQD